jgi:hypothetical protein
MRRILAPTLIGLGVFLLLTALLLRVWAYPRLAVSPVDQDSATKAEAKNATIFDTDPEVLEPFETDLTVVSSTRGDVKATEDDAPDGVLVWVDTTQIWADADGEDAPERSVSVDRVAHDEKTGEAVKCAECDTFSEAEEGEQVAIDRSGQYFKFPFGTEKKDYEFWDDTLAEALPASFEEEDEIDGLKVYKFVQTIEQQEVGTREVPGVIFDVDEPAVDATSMYGVTRTFYVEPVTGVIIDRVEDRDESIVYEGEAVPTRVAKIEYTDEQVQENVDEYRSKAMLLSGLKGWIFFGAGILGLLLLLAGVSITLRRPGGARRSE